MRTITYLILLFLVFTASTPFTARADRSGYVTSRACPYNCRDAGIKKKNCRDWKNGNTCYVEDLTRSPAPKSVSSSNRRGFVSSRSCPYSCSSRGIDKGQCRDWQKDGLCYVEDLRQSPDPSSIAQPIAPRDPPVSRPKDPYDPEKEYCRRMDRYDIARPYVNIDKVYKTGNYFKDELKVRGSIEGVCLLEAGVYEEGKLVGRIPIRTQRDFGRYEFEQVVRSGRAPEVRVYNINGDRDVRRVDQNDDYRRNDGSDAPHQLQWK